MRWMLPGVIVVSAFVVEDCWISNSSIELYGETGLEH